MRCLTTVRLRVNRSPVRSVVLALTLVATTAGWLGTRRRETATVSDLIRAGKIPAQINDVPSHNRRYRASLLPLERATESDVGDWQLRVETFDGVEISDAKLAVQPWMPENSSARGDRPRVTAAGNGVYRVEGLRLNPSGWWNVRLTVAYAGVTDSLAFNLMMP